MIWYQVQYDKKWLFKKLFNKDDISNILFTGTIYSRKCHTQNMWHGSTKIGTDT